LDNKFDSIYLRILKGILFLLLVYVLIFIAFDFDKLWIHAEALSIYPRVFSHGYSLSFGDFVSIFDYKTFETLPRIRLFEHLFEIYNIKFRIGLFNYIPYHPTFSLHWIINLVLTPVLLFKFIKNINNNKTAPWIALILYFSSVTTLGSITMICRSSKTLLLFFSVLSLFLASSLKNHLEQNKENKINFPLYFLFIFSIFLGFLSDEYMVFIYIVLPLIFSPVFFKSKNRLSICLLYTLPFLMFLLLSIFGPLIATKLNFEGAQSNIFYYLFTSDHISNNRCELSSMLKFFNIFTLIYGSRNLVACMFPFPLLFTLSSFLFFLILAVYNKLKPSYKKKIIIMWLGIIILYEIFNVFIFKAPMDTYYYGGFFTLFVLILLTFILADCKTKHAKICSLFILIFLAVYPLTIFNKINDSWKNFHQELFYSNNECKKYWSCTDPINNHWCNNVNNEEHLRNVSQLCQTVLTMKGTHVTRRMVYDAWVNRNNKEYIEKIQQEFPPLYYSMFYEFKYIAKDTEGLIKKAPWTSYKFE